MFTLCFDLSSCFNTVLTLNAAESLPLTPFLTLSFDKEVVNTLSPAVISSRLLEQLCHSFYLTKLKCEMEKDIDVNESPYDSAKV